MEVSETFFKELYYIYEYIKLKLDNVSAADKFADEAMDTAYSLEYSPFRYQIIKGAVREVKVSNYYIYYSVNEQFKIVYIHHILYKGMDITNIAIGN